MHPTAAAPPHGVVTRHSVVPGPPFFFPQVAGPAAAERDIIVTMKGLAQAATAACRRNLLRESPSSASRCSPTPASLSSVRPHGAFRPVCGLTLRHGSPRVCPYFRHLTGLEFRMERDDLRPPSRLSCDP